MSANCLPLDRRALLKAVSAAAALPAVPAFARGPAYPAVQALIDGYVQQGIVPGAVVGILKPGRFQPHWLTAGQSLFEGGHRVSPHTLWRIYSMTKPVTGIAMMQQVAEGRITLDTPIAEVMPEFRDMTVLVDGATTLDARPTKTPILVRHLLTHTAGFSYTIVGDGPVEREYRRLELQATGQKLGQRPGEANAPELGEYMRRLATVPLRYEPGTRWHYSISIDVAGALLERLTGKTLDRIFAEQLFVPLGMKDAGFWVKPNQLPRLAGNYAWRDLAGKPLAQPQLVDGPARTDYAQRPAMLSGGAGLVASADDYARFMQMMLNDGLFEGRRILPMNVARLATANQMPPGVMFGGQDGNASGGRAILADQPGNPAKYRVGTWGWGGAASTLAHIDPVRGHGVVLMLQSLGNEKGPNEGRLLTALTQDFA